MKTCNFVFTTGQPEPFLNFDIICDCDGAGTKRADPARGCDSEEKFEDCGSEYLIEHTDFEKRYIFPDRNALEAFLERKQLVRWFATLNDTKLKECTLEQLQKAKKLLQNE